MKKAKRIILLALICAFAAGAAISGAYILEYKNESDHSRELAEQLRSELQTTVITPLPEPSAGTAFALTTQAPKPDETHTSEGYLYKYLLLRRQYKEFVGWITIGENDEMSYPVMQSADNEYYLTHSVDGEENRYGAVFMDCACNAGELGRNTYVYGHHYLGGDEMFARLEKYLDTDYAAVHSSFYFSTVYDEYDCEIFSIYTTYPDDWRLYAVSFTDDADFMGYVNDALESSELDFGVEVTARDKIISLSTCDYSFNGAREIIHAVLHKRD